MVATEVTSRILVVDDNAMVSGLLERVLRSDGYAVAIAEDGQEALTLAKQFAPDLIFLDLNLPKLNGYEVCRHLKGSLATRHIPVVILTAQGEMQNKLDAWELGAADFLTKPFQLMELTARCRSLLRIKRLVEERDSAETVVFALARAVEAKSPYTHGHSERVKEYALALADAIGVQPAERERLRKGALLHDIGKISVPDAVLDKPSKLTPEEYELVKDHTRQGAHIIEPLLSLREVVPLIRWHHERLDGHGYPDGLWGEAIPELVRILSVADIYDSLASRRPYRAQMQHDLCLQVLRDNALNGGLDPDLVAVFSTTVREPDSPSAGPKNGFDPLLMADELRVEDTVLLAPSRHRG